MLRVRAGEHWGLNIPNLPAGLAAPGANREHAEHGLVTAAQAAFSSSRPKFWINGDPKLWIRLSPRSASAMSGQHKPFVFNDYGVQSAMALALLDSA
jgi:hypothetical protein